MNKPELVEKLVEKSVDVRLRKIAHARTGDKGNRTNISLIAYDARHYDLLERVAQQFAYRKPSHVARYLLPKLAAINFVLDDVLDGGVNDSLNLDMHGKALSFHLLAITVRVPTSMLLPTSMHLPTTKETA